MATFRGVPLREAETAEASESGAASGSQADAESIKKLGEEKTLLLSEMKITKGSRFNAAERLRRRDRTTTIIVSYSSACVIILTVIPIIFHVPEFANNLVNIAIIICSIVILTYSLIQYSSSDPVKAEQHHRCATEINALRRRLRVEPLTDFSSLLSFTREYDEIIQKYGVNHEVVDFETYKIDHPAEYPNLNNKKLVERDIRKDNSFLKRIVSLITFMLVGIIVSIFVSNIINFISEHKILSFADFIRYMYPFAK